MANFGEMLTTEREERGLSIEDVSRMLRVDLERLRALERNDFAALPDAPVMIDCLRAYADCLQVDAELMIEDYVRERDRCLQQLADAIPDRNLEIAPAATQASVDRRGRPPGRMIAALSVTIVVAAGLWWMLSGHEPAPLTVPSVDAASGITPSATDSVSDATASVADRSKESSNPSSLALPTHRPVPSPTPTAPALHISSFGVGTAVRNRELVGRGDRFAAGTQVWFWTQVEGGNPDDRIDHVWLREGVEAARIPLRIGGTRWRTQSSKTLRAAGAWAVEARDSAGRVLSRAEFACVR